MDAKDLELITLLNRNGRWEDETLSDRLGISPDNVKRRIRLLKREGQLKGFSAFFDRRSFGYDTTFVKLHFDMRSMDRVIDEVSRMPQVAMVYPNVDDFMWVEVVHRNIGSLKAAIKRMESISSPNTVSAHMVPRLPDDVPRRPRGADLKVLKLLVKDGRADIETISSMMGEDAECTEKRVARLVNERGVRIRPLIQEDAVTSYPAFSVLVYLDRGCKLDTCFSDLKDISRGSWDIVPLWEPAGMWIRLFGKDLHAMDTMLERYRRQPKVQDVTVVLPDSIVIRRSADLNILSGARK
ncbi:MAG: Lrp/AsnC family transcriptional regulator [Thermoplasmatota archaeon]